MNKNRIVWICSLGMALALSLSGISSAETTDGGFAATAEAGAAKANEDVAAQSTKAITTMTAASTEEKDETAESKAQADVAAQSKAQSHRERHEAGHKAGLEAGHEAGHKASLEAGHKAGLEAGHEAGHKASLEAGHKAGLEAGHEAGLEAGLEAGHEAGHKASLEAGHKASHKASLEAGLEAGHEAGHKASLEAGHEAGHKASLEAGHKAGLEVGHKAGLEAGHEAGHGVKVKTMSLRDCMSYAVSNSTKMRIRQAATDDAQINRREAILKAFIPSVSANTYAYYNFGRSIDPQTNTYFNQTSFHNNYGVSAGIALFDGFNAVNNIKIAKTSLLMGRTEEEQAEADICLAVMEAFCTAVYYSHLQDIQQEQVTVASQAVEKARRQEELGQKGHADVVQMEANLAESEYDLVLAQNSYVENLSKLMDLMFWPSDELFILDTDISIGSTSSTDNQRSYGSQSSASYQSSTENQSSVSGQSYGSQSYNSQSSASYQSSTENQSSVSGQSYGSQSYKDIEAMDAQMPQLQDVLAHARVQDPSVILAQGRVLNAELELVTAKWRLLPSLELYGGWSTSYYTYIGAEAGSTTPFRNQFKNNSGEYVELSLNIPIFSAASRRNNIARKRNALATATAEYDQKMHDIETEVARAYNDYDGAANAYSQACRKAELQEEAFRLNTKKMEQGLISSIEHKTSANSYLRAMADQLSTRLQMIIKGSIVRYYAGEDYIGQF